MDISLYRDEDLEPVADLLYEMSLHYNGRDASSREAVRENLVANILGPRSDVRLVVARDGQHVVGLATVALLYPAPKESAQLFMKELYVVASHRSRGVGRQLVGWVARYALDNQCSRFDWTAERSNPAAVAFYESLGAPVVEEKLYFRVTGDSLERLARDKS